MALIPGSYARAAGLQSEINKVTVTRVAGSEVQFRRTIDTYQKDLRYHVNQIGREQKQLKRSMRKYSKKLRDSRREQKARKTKIREDSQRLKQHAQSFNQAEQALRRATWTAFKAEGEDVSQAKEREGGETTHASESSAQPQNAAATVVPATPDSDPGGELDEKSSASTVSTMDREGDKGGGEQQPSPRVFFTKNKLPYLRAKPPPNEKSSGEEQLPKSEQACPEGSTITLTHTSDVDHLLPIIDEEGEDAGDHAKDKCTRTQFLHHPAQPASTPGQSGAPGKASLHTASLHTPAPSSHTDSVTPSSLDTRAVSKTTALHASLPDAAGDHGSHGSLSAVTSSVDRRGRRGGRKAEVSYGDLVKLQHTHTSNTKRLFQLVDHLASKHGIVDPPAPPPFRTASSLDPRSNDRIKMRGQAPDSQASDGMVRQAAVLYSIKYGYNHVTDDATITDALPPILLPQDTADDFSSMGVFPSLSDVIQKDNADARSDVTSQQLSLLSVRRGSTEVTSSVYTLSDVSSLVLDDVSAGGNLYRQTDRHTDRQTDRHASHSDRSPHRQRTSISQLSQQASQVREKSVLGADSRHSNPSRHTDRARNTPEPERTTTEGRHPRTVGKLSPLPLHARARAGESVSSEIEKRLKEPSDWGKMAWQAAFGRLKVLHTLHDLSQHFDHHNNT